MKISISDLKKYLEFKLYRMGLHRDIISHSRFSKTCKYFVRGPIKTLEIGTGGGAFTMELALLKNHLTICEINPKTIERTMAKMKKFFPENDTKYIHGHLNDIDPIESFDQVVFLEVLEHIQDDRKALQKLSKLLKPGGRIIISTPTATYGLLSSDSISINEDDGHVRVGYDGPELDYYLESLGFITVQRENYGFLWTRWLEEIRRYISKKNYLSPLFVKGLSAMIVVFYKLTFWMDLILKFRPNGQISLAIKVK